MEKKLGQETAFPCLEYNQPGHGNCITIELADGSKQYIPFKEGMSKRFYAACAAMQGLISANPSDIRGNFNYGVPSVVVEAAYAFADELLKQE